MKRRSPYRSLNPFLHRRVKRSGYYQKTLAALCGFRCEEQFHNTITEERIKASPLVVDRLTKLAAIIDFPVDELFVDGGGR